MRRSHLLRGDKVSIFIKSTNKSDFGKIAFLEPKVAILENGRKYKYCNIVEFRRQNNI